MLIDHESRVVKKFLDGATHQQIAEEYGVTRQAVQQFLRNRGLTKQQGGYLGGRIPRATRAKREAKQQAKLDRATLAVYGLPAGAVQDIRRRRAGEPDRAALKAYVRQRKAALHCRHGWALTFPEWWDVWAASGHWADRGRGLGKFALIRKDMTRPFQPDNVWVAPFCNRHRAFEGKGGTDDGQTVHPTGMPGVRDAPVGARPGHPATVRRVQGTKGHRTRGSTRGA